MNKTYFTSDLHFGHTKDFLYAPRGFDNIFDHDKTVIKNWNEVVDDDDIVYIAGDLMLNDNEYGRKCFNQLKGYKIIIRGNHDTDTRWDFYPEMRGVIKLSNAEYFQFGKYHFYISHYPTLTANKDNDKPLMHKLINICGHSHFNNKFADMDKGLIYHVELDAHNNYPVSVEDIISDITKEVEREKN